MASSIVRGALSIVCVLVCFSFYRGSHLANALSLQSMDENCIFSFVVPRHQMKSSCHVEEKVKRQLDGIEMKVNVYKHQLSELRIQLSKERQLNAQKADRLEKQLREQSMTSDTSSQIERRLSVLEREFGQLSNEIVQGRSLREERTNIRTDHDDHKSNAVDNTPVVLPNLIKSMVEAELETAFGDFTKEIKSYVQEQILVYGQVIKLMSKPQGKSNDETLFNDNPNSHDKYAEKQQDDFSQDVRNQLTRVNENLHKIGDEIAEKVSSYIQKPSPSDNKHLNRPGFKHDKDEKHEQRQNMDETMITTTSTPTTTVSSIGDKTTDNIDEENISSTLDYESFQMLNTSELTITDETPLDVNDSFSGDNPDRNETNVSKPTFTSKVIKEIPGSASSRISNPHGKSAAAGKGNEEYEENSNMWKGKMVMDEKYKAQNEAQIKSEVKSLLHKPLAELMSLVQKQTTRLADQIKTQEEVTQRMAKDFNGRMKTMDQGIESNSLTLDSLSQAAQGLFAKVEQTKYLEETLNELKQNISARQNSLPVALNEQGKKVKKLERLMGVYQQSLDHYKNEMKQEYKRMRETLMKEMINVKTISKTLKKNITNSIEKTIDRYNDSLSSQSIQMKELQDDMKNADENVLLINIDLKNLERKMNSKNNKIEREMADIRENVDVFLSKSRDFKKQSNSINNKFSALEAKVNGTSKLMEDLKTEVKLALTDSWLQIDFDFDGSRGGCYGKQYLKQTKFKKARYVGVVLCSPVRYKIYLSDSMEAKFLNIGDGDGFGEDHCEFIGGSKKNKIKLAPFKPSYGSDRGFTRNSWGQEPRYSMINAMKPTPQWYECELTIP